MSVYDQLTRDTISITGLVVTENPNGSENREYTAAGRGSKPKTAVCRAQELSVEEEVKYGLKGTNTNFGFWFNDNPQLSVQDQITFTDQSSVAWQLRVVRPSRTVDNAGQIYVAYGESLTPRN